MIGRLDFALTSSWTGVSDEVHKISNTLSRGGSESRKKRRTEEFSLG